LTVGAFCPDTPTVSLDDAPSGRKSNARAFDLTVGMKPVKRFEQAIGVVWIEPNPVIRDVKNRFGTDGLGTEGNVGTWT